MVLRGSKLIQEARGGLSKQALPGGLDLGFRILDVVCRVLDLGFRVYGLESRV